MLADNLQDLILRYGKNFAETAESVLKPVFDPAVHELPDFSPIEKNRASRTGKPFRIFDSQKIKIAGAVEGMNRFKRVWVIAGMGCGKTLISLAASWQKLHGKSKKRILVMCPGHIVNKWQREIDWLFPDVFSMVLRRFSDVKEFHAKASKHKGFAVAVVSKDTAKLGFELAKPAASKRMVLRHVELRSPKDRKKGDIGFKKNNLSWYEEKMGKPAYEAFRPTPVVACPECGAVQKNEQGELDYANYINSDKVLNCNDCGSLMATSARGFRSNPHMDRFIQLKMKRFFQVFIADEVHELAGADTAQGNTFGTLASSADYTISLTGTLIGGKAVDLHAPLWRMSPDLMRGYGFDLSSFKGGQAGAIGRNTMLFNNRYGVMEHDVITPIEKNVRYGRASRRKTTTTTDRVRPGISPNLYNHFLCGRAVFMELNELGPELPSITRELFPSKRTESLEEGYVYIARAFDNLMKDRQYFGAKRILAMVKNLTLDQWLDHPYGWEPVRVRLFDKETQGFNMIPVCTPPDLGINYETEKDKKLIELCKQEVKQQRRCCVYVCSTIKHNVRPKLEYMLTAAGLKVMCLPDSVPPIKREEWIEKNAKNMDVLIVHPKRVMTGLDLIQFPTLIWYQLGYSTHVLRQASARARRPIQKLPCKVFFLYHDGTVQHEILSLMGEKESASQALEGKFDTRSLKAMMNGGESDDILAALSEGMSKGKKDVKEIWGEVDKIENPFPVQTPTAAPPKQRAKNKPTPVQTVCSIFDLDVPVQEEVGIFALV